MSGTVTYNDVDSTQKASMIAAAMINAIHPDDRTVSLYEDAANEAANWLDYQGVGCPDVTDVLKNIVKMFGVNHWEF